MSVSIVRSEKEMTPWQWAETAADPGRPSRQLAGTYIGDLVALRKAIALCWGCLKKWRPSAVGYMNKRNIPIVRGNCDGCGERFDGMRLFVHHSVAKEI